MCFAFATSLLVSAIPASGADRPSRPTAQDSRSDRISNREDAVDAATTAIEQHGGIDRRPFNFRIDAPLYYNSNPRQVPSNGPAALEGFPEAELGWSRGLSSVPLKLSARLRASTDRYAHVPQANEDETSGTVKAQYYDVDDDQALAPFVSYKAVLLFKATFAGWTQTKNDFDIGLVKIFNFGAGLRPLPASGRSGSAAIWSILLSTSVQRRVRTPGANSTAWNGAVALGCSPATEWNIQLGLKTTQRWFDTVIMRSRPTTRRDFKLEPLLTLAWAPSAASFGSPVVALQAGLERRSSNLSRKSYAQWSVGPVLSANWNF